MKSGYAKIRFASRLPRSARAKDPLTQAPPAWLRDHVRYPGHIRRCTPVEEGSLYPALHRMEEAGWIRAQWINKDTGWRARLYEMTAAGRKQLAAEESRWQAVTAAVNSVPRMA